MAILANLPVDEPKQVSMKIHYTDSLTLPWTANQRLDSSYSRYVALKTWWDATHNPNVF